MRALWCSCLAHDAEGRRRFTKSAPCRVVEWGLITALSAVGDDTVVVTANIHVRLPGS